MNPGSFFPNSQAQTNPTISWKPNIFTWHMNLPGGLKDQHLAWNTTQITWKNSEDADVTVVNVPKEASYPNPFVFTPLFPLLLFSLARQKNSPKTKTSFRMEYDYIIVGAGSAGSVVAGRLSEEKCVSILLLEAGGAPPLLTDVPSVSGALAGTDIDWKYKTEPQKYTAYGIKNREMPMARGKALGGSSVINGMLYIRGNRKDYDNWEAKGARGWSWRDVYPYFLKAENNTDYDIVENGYHGTYGPMTVGRFPTDSVFRDVPPKVAASLGYRYHDPNGPIQVGFSDFQGNLRGAQRCSTAKAYLVPAENRRNLDIIAEAFVTKVLMSGRRAVGVQFDYKESRCEVRARKEVIVSAGSVNTPKLLMLSGIGPRETLEHFGIPVIADLPVGKNLHDHPATILNFVVRRDIPTYVKQLLSPVNLVKYITSRSGSIANAGGIFSLAFLPSNGTKNPDVVPDLEIYFLESVSIASIPRFRLRPWTFTKLHGAYLLSTTLWCIVHALSPRSRGYVSIRSTDPYDPPIIDPNYFSDPEDLQVVVKGMKICLKIARSPPMRKYLTRPFKIPIPGCEKFFFDETQYLTCYARQYIFSPSHDVGTARMGDPSDPRTVVDPELRVKGIRGLRVVDTSVMPKAPAGNTLNPVVMIAEKASDMIKETFNCFENAQNSIIY